MSYLQSKYWFHEVVAGNIPNWSYNRKFGRIQAVTTTLTPLTSSGTYQTPTTAQSLEILSSSANDTAAGTGARTVTVIGLNSSWVETSETVTMNGTSAVALSGQFIRVYRMYVATSGSYANSSASSHAGTITLRNSGAGVTWNTLILDGGFGVGQSLAGCYTVPSGYTAYVYGGYISVESTKTVTAYFFQRNNADDVTAPYDTMRINMTIDNVAGMNDLGDTHLIGKYESKTDIGWMVKTSTGTANVSCQFNIYLKAN